MVKSQKVKAELAPWERQIAEVQSRVDVAESERQILVTQQEEAAQKLKVIPKSHKIPYSHVCLSRQVCQER